MGVQVGRVIRYDVNKGFGFIAPERGGEDVFLHASAIKGDPVLMRQGTIVEFEAIEGDQGRKALTVRVVREQAQTTRDPEAETELCEVVSATEFLREVTDTLLAAAPSLTGGQIIEIRQRLLAYALDRRWLDE